MYGINQINKIPNVKPAKNAHPRNDNINTNNSYLCPFVISQAFLKVSVTPRLVLSAITSLTKYRPNEAIIPGTINKMQPIQTLTAAKSEARIINFQFSKLKSISNEKRIIILCDAMFECLGRIHTLPDDRYGIGTAGPEDQGQWSGC